MPASARPAPPAATRTGTPSSRISTNGAHAATTNLVELLIIDEAERLTPAGLELFRGRHDREHLPMILICMPGIDQRFRHYPQLYSRLGFSYHYRTLGRDELLFVLDRHWKRLGRTLNSDDFTDAQAIAAIERVTRGNFRILVSGN